LGLAAEFAGFRLMEVASTKPEGWLVSSLLIISPVDAEGSDSVATMFNSPEKLSPLSG
jgi:hypothetical protein